MSDSVRGSVSGDAVLVLRDVHRRFGSIEAVRGIDLEVGAGANLALLGPNGAGKSTTLVMALGLLTPSLGEITVLGRSPHQAIADGLVGAMLQSGAGGGVPPGTKVGELISFVASLYPAALVPSAVIATAGLEPIADRKMDALSGGELQRVRFALAISGNPRLLVLDEPTVGLDVSSRRAFWATVAAFIAEGRAVVFATHYLAEAEEVAKRVVVLNRGLVVADGSVHDIRQAVAAKRVRFRAAVQPTVLRSLPGVQRVESTDGLVTLDTTDADATVRGLYQAAVAFSDLEVAGAGLEEAFLALTTEDPNP